MTPYRLTVSHLVVAASAILLLALTLGYFYGSVHDMSDYVTWQLATTGLKPWNAYAAPRNNYPPLVHYVLTGVEAVRGVLHVEPRSSWNYVLVKVPNAAAAVIGAFALLRAMTPRVGRPRAVVIALTWAASLSFIGNVVWGQFDVLVSLFLLLAMLAVIRGNLFFFGFWLGIALSTKIQIVFAMPVAAAYLIARTKTRGTVIATAGGLTGLLLTFGPMAAAGRLHDATSVYIVSVGTWPQRSNDAWNFWELANGVERKLLKPPAGLIVDDDTRLLFPSLSTRITHRTLGMALTLAYIAALMVSVARRRTTRSLMVALPLAGVAMFMLATEMCQRYVVPPAALMSLWLLLDRRYRWQFVYWSLSAGVNQVLALCYYIRNSPGWLPYLVVGALFSVTNILMFAWLTWTYFSDRERRDLPEVGHDVDAAIPERHGRLA